MELNLFTNDSIIVEHNFDVGGSSPNVESAFSGVNGKEREGEFALNVNRCTDGVDLERGRGFSDDNGDFGVGRSSLIDKNISCP
ncbi:hypothetical protein KY285_036367 [Solanum tuberosum]|nr:hypothetical protein KY285_036367 [Solanum tuberosum]